MTFQGHPPSSESACSTSRTPFDDAVRELEAGAALIDGLGVTPLTVTIEVGLADSVRVMARVQDPITSMALGRRRFEGNMSVAVRLEPMFTG